MITWNGIEDVWLKEERMDNEKLVSKTRIFRKWFKGKQKRAAPYRLSEFSDGDEEGCDEDLEDASFRSMEMEPGTSTNELRIFVGTWNVAGRSPVGSLAVDMDEWLNLKDAADVYVLGFQEIVPLKTWTVIGAEDPTEATKWNLLIGKTLNCKYESPWLAPMSSAIPNDNYQHVIASGFESRLSVSIQTETPIRQWQCIQTGDSKYCSSKYKLMASKKMVGVFVSVWMKREVLRRYCVSNVKVCSVACGIMGYLGNKGSVSVSMSIEGTSFCFITAHLASGEKKGDEGRRNHQVSEIFRRTLFPHVPQDDNNPHPLTIFGHDQIFWFGDLNYRLYLEDNLARKLITKQDWRALQRFDQLRTEQEDGGVFQGWKEGNIEFAPTYKYSSSNGNRYSGGPLRRSGEKQRTPAWCDRILWYGKGINQISYFRSESKFSDHRPVSALFSTQIEVLTSPNTRIVAFNSILSPTNQTGKSNGEEAKSTLLSLIVKDMEASPEQTPKL